ncbi:MAG TPA: hypothetical protein VIF37_09215 [Methylobacter sp.]|jgi:hypothetical protein
MLKQCPNCQSERLIILDFVKKTEGDVSCMVGDAIDVPTNAQLDEMIDENIFDNFQCLDCGYEFNCRSSGLKQRLDCKVQNFNK